MPRVKSNVARLKRKNKIMKLAKGYFGGRSKLWKAAKESVERRFPQVPLPLGMLLRQDVALVRVVTAQSARPRQPDAFAERALGFLFGHVNLRGQGLGARGGGPIPDP